MIDFNGYYKKTTVKRIICRLNGLQKCEIYEKNKINMSCEINRITMMRSESIRWKKVQKKNVIYTKCDSRETNSRRSCIIYMISVNLIKRTAPMRSNNTSNIKKKNLYIILLYMFEILLLLLFDFFFTCISWVIILVEI